MTGWIARALVAVILATASLPPPLAAESEDDQDRVRELRRQGKILPLSSIIEHLTAKHPGRVLEVELEVENGRRIYEVEILEKGGVLHTFRLDAHSGQILPPGKDER